MPAGAGVAVLARALLWRAHFGDGFTMAFRTPWRIVANGRIAFGNEDDGHQFGLPAPLDGEARAAALLAERIVEALLIDGETGDLRIAFDGNVRIDVFNQSCGHEGWDARYAAADGSHLTLVAMGGGEIAVVES